MYKLEKRFSLPIGHRLSKHKGRCFSIHGHNFTVLVGLKSETLNENDMIIDFSELKTIVNKILDHFDHCLLLNIEDEKIVDDLKKLKMRTMTCSYDPTAEKLSELFYTMIAEDLSRQYPNIQMDYVTVYENENSKATYEE
jgi:6-pyruvoyltetrahydropterin/6-carboxytetrahydropterin synthase